MAPCPYAHLHPATILEKGAHLSYLRWLVQSFVAVGNLRLHLDLAQTSHPKRTACRNVGGSSGLAVMYSSHRDALSVDIVRPRDALYALYYYLASRWRFQSSFRGKVGSDSHSRCTNWHARMSCCYSNSTALLIQQEAQPALGWHLRCSKNDVPCFFPLQLVSSLTTSLNKSLTEATLRVPILAPPLIYRRLLKHRLAPGDEDSTI
jgi:hypothetical protein